MNNQLYHHGIKGQKWGIRRTPEQLGSLKKNVDTASSFVREAKTLNNSISNMRSHNSQKKSLENMNDSELKNIVKRMNLEQQYYDLSSKQIARGRNYVNGILDIAGSALAVTSSALTIAVAIKTLKKG